MTSSSSSKNNTDLDLDLNIVSIKCDHCNVSFNSEDEWDLHLKSGHSADDQVLISSLLALASDPGPAVNLVPNNAQVNNASESNNVYLCGECSCEFFTDEECAQHVSVAHPKNSILRENLVVETKTDEPVLEVTNTNNKPKSAKSEKNNHPLDFKCNIKGCSYFFATVESLQVHISCHRLESNGFKCQIDDCQNLLFDKWKKCSLHLWKKHGLDLDLLSCALCPGIKMANFSQLEVHNKTHSDERQFVCSVCQKGFKQMAQLRNHSVIHLDKTRSVVPSWFAKKQCDLCEKFFADSKCLKKHVQAVHSKLKPYICQVCNHQCARKSMLEMHMRQHTGEKPYECDECQYRTGDHNSLRRHKMRHSGEKPYRCTLCPYGSIQSAAFKRHMKTKHKS